MRIKTDVGVLKVEGSEAQRFLNAIVSSDIEKLETKSSQRSLLLNPTGKLIGAFWIYKNNDEIFFLVCEDELVKKIHENLVKFLIRTKAEILNLSERYVAVVSIEEPLAGEMLIDSNYLGVSSLYLSISERSDETIKRLSGETLNRLRISHGAVSNTYDLNEEIIPQESNLDIESISFSKGCFIGQELVCRIDSRQSVTPFSIFAFELETEINDQKLDDLSAWVCINSQKVAPVSSLLIGSADSSQLLAKSEIALGKYGAIARIPRKFIDQIDSREGNIEILFEGRDNSLEVISSQKVQGNFSI